MTDNESYRKRILEELIETEKNYITNLERFLWYQQEIKDPERPPDLRRFVPAMLKWQVSMFFSNVADILTFHTETFLPEFENCEDDPTSIAQVFLEWDKELTAMYSLYAQFAEARMAIIDQIGRCKFLQKAEEKLGEPVVTLDAYSMMPMHRITGKYELILKDMLKHTTEEDEEDPLKEAIATMKKVTKIVNEVEFCPLILEYKEEIHRLGKLIIRGDFRIAIRDHGDLAEPRHRHVLMFENAVLICMEQRFTHKEAVGALMRGAKRKTIKLKDAEAVETETAERTYKIYTLNEKFVLGNFGLAPPGLKWRKTKVMHLSGPSDDEKLKWAEEMFKLNTAGRVNCPDDDSDY